MNKKCYKCGLEKELNAENFHRKTASKDGFSSNCKVCKKERDQQRYEKNKYSIKEAQKERAHTRY